MLSDISQTQKDKRLSSEAEKSPSELNSDCSRLDSKGEGAASGAGEGTAPTHSPGTGRGVHVSQQLALHAA